MNLFHHDTHNISAHYLPALINGDYSGLNDEDELLLEDYLKQFEGFYITFNIDEDEEEPYFTRCAISNLRSDCITVGIYLELIHKDNEVNSLPDLFFYRNEKTDTPRHNSVTGYGSKIPTQYLLHCDDGYMRRVYAHFYSNAASLSGYGSKLPTQYLLHCDDGYKRRVYARCYSNVASLYIVVQGKEFYLHDYQL